MRSPDVQGALKVIRALNSGDYVTFFRCWRQQDTLHRSLMTQYVAQLRGRAIKVKTTLLPETGRWRLTPGVPIALLASVQGVSGRKSLGAARRGSG